MKAVPKKNVEMQGDKKKKKETVGRKLTILSQIGAGAYGSVSKCEDEFGRVLAVKNIPAAEHGVISIMELLIMGTERLRNPYLVESTAIHLDADGTYIFQPLAISSLSRVVTKDVNSLSLKRWLLMTAIGLNHLHSSGILHGDVKAGNVLLFDDYSVKLGDYGFALPMGEYKYKAGTPSHRAPECDGNTSWSTPADIWSLGCTFYEIAFHCNLFSTAVDSNTAQSMTVGGTAVDSTVGGRGSDTQQRKPVTISTLHDEWKALYSQMRSGRREGKQKGVWGSGGKSLPEVVTLKESSSRTVTFHTSKPSSSTVTSSSSLTQEKHLYGSPNFCSSTSNRYLDDLIIRMLDPDPSSRITMEEILKHEYFSGIERKIYTPYILPWVAHYYPPLSWRDSLGVEEMVGTGVGSSIAYWLLDRIRNLKSIDDNLKRYTVCVIVSKMLRLRIPKSTSWSQGQKKEAEILILQYIQYSFE